MQRIRKDEKNIKINPGTIPYRIMIFLRPKKLHTKAQICSNLKLKRSSVDRGCRILRKQEIIFMFKRKWWGV